MNFLSQFSAAQTQVSNNLFTALGIDWRLLIIQIIAFVLLVMILGKFVYPWLMKSVDERQANIEAAAKAATQAQELAAKNEEKVAALLADARKEAADIVSTAKLESAEIVSSSEKKALASAERIVNDAQAQLEKDIARARTELHNETLELVGLATEKVIGATLSKEANSSLIQKAVKESQ